MGSGCLKLDDRCLSGEQHRPATNRGGMEPAVADKARRESVLDERNGLEASGMSDVRLLFKPFQPPWTRCQGCLKLRLVHAGAGLREVFPLLFADQSNPAGLVAGHAG
jgi:hypothetical protein